MEATGNNLSPDIDVKEPKQEYEYSCDICGKLCNNKTTLLRHRKHHTEDAQHACDKCGKTYHEKHELKIHYRIHTGIDIIYLDDQSDLIFMAQKFIIYDIR